MLPLPKKIKLGYNTIIARYEENPVSHDGERVWGYWHGSSDIITIDKNIKGTPREKDIFLHELFHAIADHFHLDQISQLTEETAVRIFATGLTTLLNDNKKLREYLAS